MQPVDYVLLAIVFLSALVGLFRGLLREAIALIAWLFALWGGWRFSGSVEPYLGGVLAHEPYRTWAARALVALLILLTGTAIAAIVGYFVRLSIFNALDRLLGFFFGLLRGAIIVGLLVMLAQYLRVDGEPWWKASRLMPYAEGLAGTVRGIVGASSAPN